MAKFSRDDEYDDRDPPPGRKDTGTGLLAAAGLALLLVLVLVAGGLYAVRQSRAARMDAIRAMEAEEDARAAAEAQRRAAEAAKPAAP